MYSRYSAGNKDMKMDLHKTDPEFMERLEHFAFEEAVSEKSERAPVY